MLTASAPARIAVRLLDRHHPSVYNQAALQVLAGMRTHPYSHRAAYDFLEDVRRSAGCGDVHFFVETPPFLLERPQPKGKAVILSDTRFDIDKAHRRGGIWVVVKPFAKGVRNDIHVFDKDRSSWWKAKVYNILGIALEDVPTQHVVARLAFGEGTEMIGVSRFEPLPPIPTQVKRISLLMTERKPDLVSSYLIR